MPEESSRPRILTPRRWPVRWRLAGVSAGLTFIILLGFAAVVGKLAQERLEDDFRTELQSTANRIAFTVQVDPQTGDVDVPIDELTVGDVAVRVTPPVGQPLENFDAEMPAPEPGDIVRFGDLEVATAQVATPFVGAGITYVQVARDHDELDATISRLWFFLAVGVAAGAILATLAGLAVAGRAMGPIANLTSTAREIAATRDPARTMPKPEADDEVAELATTLDDMLRELDAARNEAHGLVQAQREFIADASHELRTPLTSILANLELLQHALETKRSGDEPEIVESALRSSRRMRRLVGDLLILARADAGREGARRPCDLAAITVAAAAEVRPVAGDRTVTVDAEPASVEGNPDELHRVALNLIDNGVRHTPPGTAITVRVFRRDDDVILEVADDGPGIPEELAGQVFGRFVRGAGPADVTADAGTGLGLSIVRAVATSHGGSVEVGRSNHGGALFTVTLPALTDAPAEALKNLSRVL